MCKSRKSANPNAPWVEHWRCLAAPLVVGMLSVACENAKLAGSAADPDVYERDGDPGSAANDSGHTDGRPADPRAPADGRAVSYVTLVMAGDIAEKDRTAYARANAALVASHTPTVSAVVLAGDNARYEPLTLPPMTLLRCYQTYYQPVAEASWGQFDAIAFPQLGNHEYAAVDPKGYFDYFAARMAVIAALPSYHGYVDDVSKGYYSFDINGWHVVSLNSNCAFFATDGGCAADGSEETWLRADLAAHNAMPIVATWHAPRYACGGEHGDSPEVQALWADLYDAGADFVFTGHEHLYERWLPLDKAEPAAVDSTHGLTQIICGSYGVSTYAVCDPLETRVANGIGGDPAMGVLFFTLGSDGSYSFEYQLQSDGSVFDSGSGWSHHS